MRYSSIIALGASGVAMGQFTNSSMPTATPTGMPPADGGLPGTVGDYQLYGCAGSSAGFPGFKMTASTENNGLDFCGASCTSRFMGVYGPNCYCGEELDEDTTTKVANAMCNKPCPGNDMQACGGLAAGAGMMRRQSVPLTVLLSLYIRVRDAGPGPSGTMTGSMTGSMTGTETGTGTMTGAGGSTITSTITSTHVGTITSCPPSVTDCPIGSKTTKVITKTTEICPMPTWHKKKIVCYGNNCVCDFPCYGEDCERHRVVCDGKDCHAEVCPNNQDYSKLVVCDNGDCKYSQCDGEDCQKKVVCYNGMCSQEKCIGNECDKRVVCDNGDCQHQTCDTDCHTTTVCDSGDCNVQPPCDNQCPVPPPPMMQSMVQPQPPSSTGGSMMPNNGGNIPSAPITPPGNPGNSTPPVIGGSDKMVPALGFTLFGAVAGLAIFL